jgi:hypothetical protein
MNPLDALLSLGHEVVDLVGARLAPLASGSGSGSHGGSSGPSHPPPAVSGELSEAFTARTGIVVPAGLKFDPWAIVQRADGGFDLGLWIPVGASFASPPV